MKRRIGLWASIILMLSVCFQGCAESSLSAAQSAPPTLTSRIYLLFGLEEAEVFEELNQPTVMKVDEKCSQKTVSLNCGEEETCIQARLTFYNGILMACDYVFDSHEAAGQYAQNVMRELESEMGAPTTYPGVVSDGKGYLSERTDGEQPAAPFIYYEDWTVEVEDEIIGKMVGDMDVSRVDLRLEMTILLDDAAAVTLKYMVVRNGLRE